MSGKIFTTMEDLVFKKDPPLTGGNTRQTYIDLKVQIDKDLSNLRAIENAMSTMVVDTFKDKTYDEWRLLNFQGDYFCNLFPVVTDSVEWNEKIQLAKRIAFLYGECGIMRDKRTGKFIVVYIKKLNVSYTGTILRAWVAPAAQVLGFRTMDPKPERGWDLQGEDVSPENFVVYKFDTLGWGAWYRFWPFIKQQDTLLKILGTDAYSYIKKFTYKVTDPTALKKEMEQYFNPANPFLVVTDIEDNLGNRFNVLEAKTNTSSMTLIDYYKFWENTYYNLLGRRQNSDQKRERNVSDEVQASQSNFDVLENDMYIHLVNFLKRLERMTGLKFRYAKNEIDQEKEESENVI